MIGFTGTAVPSALAGFAVETFGLDTVVVRYYSRWVTSTSEVRKFRESVWGP